MTAHELADSFCLHDSSLISVTRSADLPCVFDAEILEAKPLSDRKLLLCLFLTKKDEQVYAELNVTADDFYPEVTI